MRRLFFRAAVLAATSMGFAAAVSHDSAWAQGRPRIALYQEDNYRGASIEVSGEVARIKQMHFDDRVSSIRVLSGTWLLCEDDVFRGRCITVSRDVPRLDRMGFDDKLSSLRPVSRRDDRRDGRRGDRRDDRRDRRN
jgi:hypothetical protein